MAFGFPGELLPFLGQLLFGGLQLAQALVVAANLVLEQVRFLRPFLLAGAAVCLVGAAVLLWQQRKAAACSPDAICARPAIRSVTVIGLLVGLALLYLGYAYA